VLVITLAVQVARIGAIWCCGEAVGIDVSPLVYVILGPLLFLVTMVPFTINGLGVREAFFVAFLGRFGVDADAAFAAGFLYFAISIAVSVPGGVILLWRSVRPARARPQTEVPPRIASVTGPPSPSPYPRAPSAVSRGPDQLDELGAESVNAPVLGSKPRSPSERGT
jgi:hypothetical protein